MKMVWMKIHDSGMVRNTKARSRAGGLATPVSPAEPHHNHGDTDNDGGDREEHNQIAALVLHCRPPADERHIGRPDHPVDRDEKTNNAHIPSEETRRQWQSFPVAKQEEDKDPNYALPSRRKCARAKRMSRECCVPAPGDSDLVFLGLAMTRLEVPAPVFSSPSCGGETGQFL